MSYFDHNATTPLSPAAREAWLRASDEAWENPSSLYRSAARVRNLLESARARLAELLGCEPSRVIFNSGGTEGVNALFRHCGSAEDLKGLPLLLSPIEHTCVREAAGRHFPGRTQLLDSNAGQVDRSLLAEALRPGSAALVSVMAANNETGTLQPWPEIAGLCAEAGTWFHCDAAQWVGKLPVEGLGHCSFVTASAHKFGGPKGCGFLILPPGLAGFRSQVGGQQEHGARAGTENYPAVAAMLAALEEADGLARDAQGVALRITWREEFEREARRRLPGSRIAGVEADRLWNTVSLVLPFATQDRWVRKLDRAGFEVSTGSACSSGKEAPSHVLAALGFSSPESKRAIRISAGWRTTPADWQALINALEAAYRALKTDTRDDGLTEVVQI